MDIFKQHRRNIGSFAIFGVTEDRTVRSGVDWSAGLRIVYARRSKTEKNVSYAVMHHGSGKTYISMLMGSIYSAATYMLVCIQHGGDDEYDVAHILLDVEPAREWKACEEQMIRAANLMAAVGQFKDVKRRHAGSNPIGAYPRNQPTKPDRAMDLPRNMTSFWRDMVRHFAEHMQLDGCDFEDIAEKYGLIERQPFDPEKHNVYIDAEPGDIIWVDAVPKDYHG